MENIQWENQPLEDNENKVSTMDISLNEDDEDDEFSIDDDLDLDDQDMDELDY